VTHLCYLIDNELTLRCADVVAAAALILSWSWSPIE